VAHGHAPDQARDRTGESPTQNSHGETPCKNRAWRCGLIQQLRIYEIFERNKAAFHARFRDHAMRIMRTYGFEFIAMGETTTDRRTEFVYLLSWPDVATKEAAWRDFMADAEWKEIKRVTAAEHGDLVGEIEDRVLVPTTYFMPKVPIA
jgi:NIPSNAP